MKGSTDLVINASLHIIRASYFLICIVRSQSRIMQEIHLKLLRNLCNKPQVTRLLSFMSPSNQASGDACFVPHPFSCVKCTVWQSGSPCLANVQSCAFCVYYQRMSSFHSNTYIVISHSMIFLSYLTPYVSHDRIHLQRCAHSSESWVYDEIVRVQFKDSKNTCSWLY